jgi:hypothetical protein
MQRFFVLIVLLCFSLPVGLSIAGCGHNTNNYCLKNGHAYGLQTNQVAYVTMGPQTTGISLAWGQTQSVNEPSAFNCNNDPETVTKYTYGSLNPTLADISPTGEVCAGTWNRYSQGLVAPYTVCTPPSGAETGSCGTTASPNSACGVTQVTATGAGVTSNPVNVYVHPPITSIVINPSSATQTGCFSEGVTVPSTLLSATSVSGSDGPIPQGDVGTITYTAQNPDIVTINNTSQTTTGSSPNGTVTAKYPGSTLITASVAGSSSAAGYFYTCPPTSIALSVNGSTDVTITPNSQPTVNATMTDKNGAKITGVSLDYSSTQPQNLQVSSTGAITENFPSTAIINAICQPTTCNPAPINQIGVYGTGLPIVSNDLTINAPGRASEKVWMASTNSQYVSSVDLTTGTTASSVQLPYVPNSMVADAGVNDLYLGNYRELMIFSTNSNSLSKADTSVPGVVLAVSADNTQLVINDQLRKVIYLYSISTGTNTSIAGLANHAEFSPDGKTVYITGPDTLYVHNVNTGWSTYPINNSEGGSCTPAFTNTSTDPYCGRDLALMVPQEGPFVTGTTTTAYSFCPDTTVTPPVYYPQAASVAVETDHLGATPDGEHMIGATDTGIQDMWVFSDAGQTTPGPPTGACPQPTATTSNGFTLYPYTVSTPFTGISPSEIDQVVTSPDSSVAFVTYQSASASGLLPAYQPSTTAKQQGTLSNVQLSGSAGAPIDGAFSPDGSLFFISTTGDDLVHIVNSSTLKDTGTISPNLVDTNNKPTAAQFVVVKSRTTT